MKLHKIDEICSRGFKPNPFTSFMSCIQEIEWNKNEIHKWVKVGRIDDIWPFMY
jgi:hypothetical protein